MNPLEMLQGDHVVLSQILEARRTVTMETMPFGLRTAWWVYLTILEDALATLNSLINYLAPDTQNNE